MNLPTLTWPTFWSAVTALATLAGVLIVLWQIWKKHPFKKRKVFLSMQMSEIPDEYVQVRHEIMEIVYELRQHHKVYFFNEFIQNPEVFDENRFDSEKYLRKIEGCDFFIAVFSDKVVSSIYFEAGYALAHRKRSIYFVSNDNVLPMLMRRLVISREHSGIQIFKATELPEIKTIINNILRNAN